jgi:hypothetical protein
MPSSSAMDIGRMMGSSPPVPGKCGIYGSSPGSSGQAGHKGDGSSAKRWLARLKYDVTLSAEEYVVSLF